MDETQQLQKILESLPEKLQQFINSGEWRTRLNTVLPKYSLTPAQAEAVTDEVKLSLLGITDPDDLPISFQAMAEMSPEQAEKLAVDVENVVFAPVNNELGKLDPLSLDEYRSSDILEVNTALAKLPKALQEVIVSADTENKIQTIGQKYQLHIDQIGALDEEVNNVLFGVLPPGELIGKIKARLGMDQATTDAITREVNEQIFLKIRESLQALHGANEVPKYESGPRHDVGATNSNYGVEMLPSTNAPTPPGIEGEMNREKIIDGIENPAQTPEDSVFEQKMGKLFRIPREEVDLDPYLEKPK